MLEYLLNFRLEKISETIPDYLLSSNVLFINYNKYNGMTNEFESNELSIRIYLDIFEEVDNDNRLDLIIKAEAKTLDGVGGAYELLAKKIENLNQYFKDETYQKIVDLIKTRSKMKG